MTSFSTKMLKMLNLFFILVLFNLFAIKLYAQQADTKAPTEAQTDQDQVPEPSSKTTTSSKPMVLAPSSKDYLHSLPMVQINGKVVKMHQLKKDFPGQVYEFEKHIYDRVSELSARVYLETFFQDLAKEKKVTVEKAKEDYFAEHVKIKDFEVKSIIEQMKTHPQTKSLSDPEREKQARLYIKQSKESDAHNEIFKQAIDSGKLKILWTYPKRPPYNITIFDDDFVRYGSDFDEIKPVKCSEDQCEITIIEFSEYQCPFCARVLPVAKKILDRYRGRIRWVVKDLPLDFHKRARPAAIVAGCAAEQGKFWHMYHELFQNQDSLEDDDFIKYAKKIKVYNKDFKDCIAKPDKQNQRIDRSMDQAFRYSVNGTPALIVNGEFFSGAVPYEKLVDAIEKSL